MSRRHVAAGAALGACLVLGVLSSHEARAVAAALVNITNTAANPVPTRETDRFNGWGARVNPNPRTAANVVVPAGKRLVVTSITGFNNGGLSTDLAVDVTYNGNRVEQRIPFHRPQANGIWYLESAHVELIADPGSTVSFFITGPSTDTAGFNIDVRGYYVDAP